METTIAANQAGKVAELPVEAGGSVGAGQVVAVIE
jgi:biotin carboxyl carrier protein